MSIQLMIIFALASCGAVGLLMWPLVIYLRTNAILDHPNDRSSHHAATPKGAGLVIVPVIGAAWLGAAWIFDDARFTQVSVLIAGGVLLAAVSWVDDLKNLPVVPRLAVHTAVAAMVISVSPDLAHFFGTLTGPGPGMVLTVVLWVWFINLFNFMDGIDGISGINILTISIGTVLIVAAGKSGDVEVAMYASIAAGAALGFLVWNWPPARVFLGDVGSAPLGFFVGWLLLLLLQNGNYLAALILPLYYFADATLTLLKRAVRREKFWQAHRGHHYQLAVRRGLSHRHVCGAILVANATMAGLALVGTLWWPHFAFVGATVAVAILLMYLRGGRKINIE